MATNGKKAPSDYARCKGFGHQWDDAPAPPNTRNPPRGYGHIHFRCMVCGTLKRYTLDVRTGESRVTYWRPVDYSEIKDTRREWKLAFYKAYRS